MELDIIAFNTGGGMTPTSMVLQASILSRDAWEGQTCIPPRLVRLFYLTSGCHRLGDSYLAI